MLLQTCVTLFKTPALLCEILAGMQQLRSNQQLLQNQHIKQPPPNLFFFNELQIICHSPRIR